MSWNPVWLLVLLHILSCGLQAHPNWFSLEMQLNSLPHGDAYLVLYVPISTGKLQNSIIKSFLQNVKISSINHYLEKAALSENWSENWTNAWENLQAWDLTKQWIQHISSWQSFKIFWTTDFENICLKNIWLKLL